MATKRKFKKVPKTSGGTPKKYVKDAKNKSKAEKEIKSTAKKYKSGKLTKKQMDAVVKARRKNVKR